jgi:16S rRNA (uracil1498-N3)-methyltransferase
MNIILIKSHELLRNNQIILDDDRSRHIIKILKAAPGDTLKMGILNGPMGKGEITAISNNQISIKFKALPETKPGPRTDIILALPRPIMLKRVLSQAAMLGVSRLFLVNAKRVEKSFFNASLLKEENYRQFLQKGLEQAVATHEPKVSIHSRFRPFVEDFLSSEINNYSTRLIAHPDTSKFIHQASPSPVQGNALLAIGPEGGWVDFELKMFKKSGMAPFSLGPRILRVDSAIVAVISQLDLLRHIL